jgi:hypothetical protein
MTNPLFCVWMRINIRRAAALRVQVLRGIHRPDSGGYSHPARDCPK